MRILGEEALARLPTVVPGKVAKSTQAVLIASLIFEQVSSPCGEVLGLVECPGPPVCVVSIVRSGDILQVESFNQRYPLDRPVLVTECRPSSCLVIKHLRNAAIAVPRRSDQSKWKRTKEQSLINRRQSDLCSPESVLARY